MGNRFTTIPAVLAVIAVTAFPTGCFHRSANSEQSTANPVAAEFATALRNKVTADGMMRHLSKLQDIANANNGPRAVGTPGYDATLEYVVNPRRDPGFAFQPRDSSPRVFPPEKPVLTVGGKPVESHP